MGEGKEKRRHGDEEKGSGEGRAREREGGRTAQEREVGYVHKESANQFRCVGMYLAMCLSVWL